MKKWYRTLELRTLYSMVSEARKELKAWNQVYKEKRNGVQLDPWYRNLEGPDSRPYWRTKIRNLNQAIIYKLGSKE